MGGKKLKTSNGDGLNKRKALTKSKRKKNEEKEHSQKIVDSDEKLRKLKEKKKKDKSSEKGRNSLEDVTSVEMKKSKIKNKKRQRERVIVAEIDEQSDYEEITEETKEGEVGEEIFMPKKVKKKKRKSYKIGEVDEVNDKVQLRKDVTTVEMKKSKLKNKKRQREEVIEDEIGEPSDGKEITKEKKEMEGAVDEQIITPKKAEKKKRKNDKIGKVAEVNNEVQEQKGKSKRARKAEKKDQMLSNNNEKEKVRAEEDYEVYEISSEDEDSTAGMTKWVSEYHKARPGLEILQQRIDDFITDHEAKEEQAREEKEARMAEDGWTFVGPQKGRKKTADSDGVVVGSVAEAAVRDKVSKKETKLVGSDFYRFQKREAHRNEIMKLQSKFEEDKKRIQQMRATRKFRPY